jgi:hypothetical protein
MDAIERLVGFKTLDVWCAFEELNEKRDYLSRRLLELYQNLESASRNYFKRGAISKAGHPHHPLYLKKTAPMEVFDLKRYVEMVKR